MGSEMCIRDSSKAKDKLGWQAQTKFEDLVAIMVEADLEVTARD